MVMLARLPKPVQESYDWQAQGACRQANPAAFFSPESERGPRRARREAMAKALCSRCPVIDRCLEHALAVKEPFGVWGGLNTREREDLLATRHRRSA